MDSSKGSNVKIQFCNNSEPSDPQQQPVLIVGQLTNLNKLSYNQVKHKLEPRVTEEVWKLGVSSLHPTLTDSVSLYLGLAVVSTLPSKCSRHNSPARPHALTGVIKSACCATSETIIVVCKWDEIFASALAIARAYPLYSRKSVSNKSENQEMKVTVEYILVDDGPKEIPTETLETLVEAVRMTASIVDTPCSEMNVNHFLQEIKSVASKYNLSLKIIQGEELKEQGFNGIWSVGQASEVGPALAVLSYKCPDKTDDKPVIAWVGKGIVYDTGGLSIKGKLTMPGMKRDCGGAAAILGSMAVAGKLGFTTDLHAVFCLAENSVGPKSTRPDDIYKLYSGRSVEINNTDAEGRLVLADGVAYANKDLKADIIYDMATLTGAQGVATGKYHGAVLTNSENWEIDCMEAGRTSGDLTFPIPFSPELHFSEYSSAMADMKNSVQDRCNAQSSCAGLFILAHIGFDFSGSWIHIDMAAPVHSGERATGYGVGLTTLLFGKYSKDEMIQKLAPKSNKN